jgi:4-hydroxy-4-methyl-2-oxoglutarate aldolase
MAEHDAAGHDATDPAAPLPRPEEPFPAVPVPGPPVPAAPVPPVPFPAATLHEAAGRIGALPSVVKPAFPGARTAGPAYPVGCPAGDNLWIHRAVLAASPGDVLVVSTGGAAEFGYWGEILSTAAVARGLAGLVIDGGVRDQEALGSLGFPVFSAGLCIRGTAKEPRSTGSLGTPVRIGEVTIGQGDLVVGDADGVVVIPAADTARVLHAAAAREAAEAGLMRQIRDGETTIDLLGLG